jgi:hypothetical protein
MWTKVKVASVTLSRWLGLEALRPGLDVDLHRGAPDALDLGIDLEHVTTRMARMKVIASTAIVTTRPRAHSTPAMPPAWSMCAITQPPKMSPLALVSAGIAMVRTVSAPRGTLSSGIGCFPNGGSSDEAETACPQDR